MKFPPRFCTFFFVQTRTFFLSNVAPFFKNILPNFAPKFCLISELFIQTRTFILQSRTSLLFVQVLTFLFKIAPFSPYRKKGASLDKKVSNLGKKFRLKKGAKLGKKNVQIWKPAPKPPQPSQNETKFGDV